jgi:hypothetical protein
VTFRFGYFPMFKGTPTLLLWGEREAMLTVQSLLRRLSHAQNDISLGELGVAVGG